MNEAFSILVTDKNGHVREFLRRELHEDGYRVYTVRDGRDLLSLLEGETRLDLLILDLEIPYADESLILEQVLERRADLPVVIHTHTPEALDSGHYTSAMAIVEKSGDTDTLRRVVRETLQHLFPRRFASTPPPPHPR